MKDPIKVTAALIMRGTTILIARRAPGLYLSGYWEFAGGQIEEGETPEICLKREIKEELGVEIKVLDFFMETEYAYPDKIVLLKAYWCELITDNFVLTDHNYLKWVEPKDFDKYNLAPADIAIANAIRSLPEYIH